MSSSSARFGMHTGTHDILIAHYDRTKHLPHPDERFKRSDVHEHLRPMLDRLESESVIQKVDREIASSARWIYRTEPRAYRIIDDYEPQSLIMPCGHRGMSNEGDHFECGFDACEEHFTRTQVEEAIEG